MTGIPQREIIQALLDFGADVNYKNENDITPFFMQPKRVILSWPGS